CRARDPRPAPGRVARGAEPVMRRRHADHAPSAGPCTDCTRRKAVSKANGRKCDVDPPGTRAAAEAVREVTTMNPVSIAMPAPIPADVLGTLVPAALFGIWSILVLAVIAALCAALGMEARAARRAEGPVAVAARGSVEGERDAA